MSTYRAAYIGETLLTLPEHAGLHDHELRLAAQLVAEMGGLLGDEPHQWTHKQFSELLEIGDWTE